MGFFKKIGKGLKKFAKKNIRFKNLVKLGSMVDPTGLVGGLQEAHYAKKEGRALEAEMMAQNAGANAINYASEKGLFGHTIQGATSQAGSTAINWSLNTWLKNNWQKVVVGVLAVGAFVFAIVRLSRPRVVNGRRR